MSLADYLKHKWNETIVAYREIGLVFLVAVLLVPSISVAQTTANPLDPDQPYQARRARTRSRIRSIFRRSLRPRTSARA